MPKEQEIDNFVRLGADLKERERAAHKLELCPKGYLPIIEVSIDAAIGIERAEDA